MFRGHFYRGILGLAAGYILYRNLLMCIPVGLLFFIYSTLDKNRPRDRKIAAMSAGFRNFLICLEPLLKSSETFSSAYFKAVDDYEKMYGSDNLLPALKSGTARFRINATAGEVLHHLAEITGIEDAYLFAGSIESSEETGINIIDITGHTLGIITEKIQLRNELFLVLSGKRFEHLLVSIIPVVILVLLSAGTGSYMAPLYETTAGRLVMTAVGVIFAASWYAGRKITSIEV